MHPTDQFDPMKKSQMLNGADRPNLAFNLPAQIGAAIFMAWFLAILAILWGLLSYDNEWREHLSYIVFGTIVIFGPIFLAIAGVTKRTLRRFAEYRIRHKHVR